VAEKFQAMVALGLASSHMKDFYDVWVLSKNCRDGHMNGLSLFGYTVEALCRIGITVPAIFRPGPVLAQRTRAAVMRGI
jgi:Nucleotidyl transferase AbiEii toxin, Type IV TA system